eukprot:gnl/Ergobibamus_cyprinoides/1241.p2 GENE.gnl/Ergobibamus_cyprinoides/1241~~gnl/Ergobibamus_cyprinoides/1241.p2  ORF type:complete len:156 (-),score=35.84 gnl/Ergobibamus_cyprinoides/1241:253-720(-)
MLAVQLEKVALASVLAPFEAGRSNFVSWYALDSAAFDGNIRLVSLLAPLEARIEAAARRAPAAPGTGGRHCTALMNAIVSGHPKAARLLVPYQAGCVDGDGESALKYAVVRGDTGLIRLLWSLERHLPQNQLQELADDVDNPEVLAVIASLQHLE